MTPLDYAKLAQEAYDARPDIGIADSASRAIVRHTADGLVVAFRGSDDASAWLHDFTAIPVPIDGMGVVHLGFWHAWDDIAAQVIAAIGDQPVTFVGHSLAGAMASIAAAAMVLAGKRVNAVWAFEPPRPSFDLTLRTLLAKVPMHLYKNASDPVPDVPLGGVHPGLLIHIGGPDVLMPHIDDHLMQNVMAALQAQVVKPAA